MFTFIYEDQTHSERQLLMLVARLFLSLKCFRRTKRRIPSLKSCRRVTFSGVPLGSFRWQIPWCGTSGSCCPRRAMQSHAAANPMPLRVSHSTRGKVNAIEKHVCINEFPCVADVTAPVFLGNLHEQSYGSWSCLHHRHHTTNTVCDYIWTSCVHWGALVHSQYLELKHVHPLVTLSKRDHNCPPGRWVDSYWVL